MIPGLFWQTKKRRATYLRDHNLSASTRRSVMYLLVVFIFHSLLMIEFEGMTFGDALWLTLTTATTVGYGDISATTLEGRLSTVIVLYFGGIFILANFAGEYFESRLEKRSRKIKGHWRWEMQDHLVIVNTPERNGVEYFVRLITQFRKSPRYRDTPIQILTRQFPDGLPIELRNLGVVHFHGNADNSQNLEAVNIKEADSVIILAKDEYVTQSDALSFDILYRMKELGINSTNIIAEVVDDQNRDRFLSIGATSVVRPIRAYPELLIRTLVAPGSEKILENLFQHDGDHTVRYEVSSESLTWTEIVTRLMQQGFGTAIAYIDQNGLLICNPNPSVTVNMQAILILVRAVNVPTSNQVLAQLAKKSEA